MKNLQHSKQRATGPAPKAPEAADRGVAGGRDGARGARWGGAPVSMTTALAGWGGTSGVGEPAGMAYRVAALQIAVLVAKGRDVDLHGRCGAAPLLAPQHRAVRPASRCPPGARARTAQGARPGPGSAARGQRARAAWGSAGPRHWAFRAARISWAREAGLAGRSLHRRVCAATRGAATRVSPALRAPDLRGAHPRVGASGGRKMMAFEILPGWGWLRLSC